MIEIKKDNAILLLRFNNYKEYDFISEHKNILDDNGAVWMLKVGRKIPTNRLNSIMSDGGILILKAPKQTGGRFYCAHIQKIFFGSPTYDMKFPTYYFDMVDDENLWIMEESLEGIWLCIDQLTSIDDVVVNHLFMLKNDKKARDVLSQTMTAVMYIRSDEDFSVIEGS